MMVKITKVMLWFCAGIILWKMLFKKREKQYYNVEEY